MIELIETCDACPEQYDAFLDGQLVGYLRLRHGYFSVECPNSGGELVYSAYPYGDGIFEYEERDKYLNVAKEAIYNWIIRSKQLPNIQSNLEVVLNRLISLAKKDEDFAEMFASDLDCLLDDYLSDDQFGSEGQTDPRGDHRNGDWTINNIEQ
jgi:hypothetical protein